MDNKKDSVIDSIHFNHQTVGDDAEDFWRLSLEPFFAIDKIEEDRPKLETYIDIYSLDSITCMEHQFNSSMFTRDKNRISQFDNDCIGLCYWVEGANDVVNSGEIISAKKNSIFLMDMGKPTESFASASVCRSIVLPKSLFAQFNINPNTLGGAAIHYDDPRFAILSSALDTTFGQLPKLNYKQAGQVGAALSGLVGGIFSSPDEKIAPEAKRFIDSASEYCVMEFIDANLKNPELSIEYISKKLPYSRSSLFRQFSKVGGIARYIKIRRLQRCLMEFTSRRHAAKSINVIAESWGFNNASHFSKIFRQQYGMSPSDAREKAFVEQMSGGSSLNHKALVEKAQDWFSKTSE